MSKVRVCLGVMPVVGGSDDLMWVVQCLRLTFEPSERHDGTAMEPTVVLRHC